MSLRDWFAGQATMPPDGISETWATAIMGCKPPDWLLDDKMACVLWWSEAEARARYISADAMLKARSPSQESSRG